MSDSCWPKSLLLLLLWTAVLAHICFTLVDCCFVWVDYVARLFIWLCGCIHHSSAGCLDFLFSQFSLFFLLYLVKAIANTEDKNKEKKCRVCFSRGQNMIKISAGNILQDVLVALERDFKYRDEPKRNLKEKHTGISRE